MYHYIVHAGIIAFVYLFIRFLEMRISKNSPPKHMKELIKDTIIVYLSSVIGMYIIQEFIDSDADSTPTTAVFTGQPGF